MNRKIPCLLRGIVSHEMHNKLQMAGVSCSGYDRDEKRMVISIDKLAWDRKILGTLEYIYKSLMEGSIPTITEDSYQLVFTEKE